MSLGYKVYALPDTLVKSKNEASLWTHLRVKEDALDLYGFESYPEMEFFETLIQISGIGPKSAMGILSIAPLDTIKKSHRFRRSFLSDQSFQYREENSGKNNCGIAGQNGPAGRIH